VQLAEVLLEAGGSLEAKNAGGLTPRYVAAAFGREQLLEALSQRRGRVHVAEV